MFKNNKLISNEFSYSDDLTYDIIAKALRYGTPEKIYWYERPWIKKVRQLRAGQWSRVFDKDDIPRYFINKLGFKDVPIIYTPHHGSHAAAGFYTSPFKESAVVVLDAIGEFECASIWHGKDDNLKKVWSRNYPHSLGLFYSAFTQLIGQTPIKEEFVLQNFSEKGNSKRFYNRISNYFKDTVKLNVNFHRGVPDWHAIDIHDRNDISASVQRVFEEQVDQVMMLAKNLTNCDNLVYMGGCAMNSLYNKNLDKHWKHVWSLPQPGDPTSSIGAVLYHTKVNQNDYNFGNVKHLNLKV